MLERKEIKEKTAFRLITIGGYLILFGIFLGVTLGVYILFNPLLFSIFNTVSYYEAVPLFLGVHLPCFVTIVAIGYLFVTTSKLEGLTLWWTVVLCSLTVLCLAFSALSILNILSFLGGIAVLIGLITMHTKSTFRVLWKREASFFVETGTMLIASSSMLFLLILLISKFLNTFSAGAYEVSYTYPYLLLLMLAFSLLAFLLASFLGLYGSNTALSGVISLAMGVLSLVTLLQNQYTFFNQIVWQGLFLAGVGTTFVFIGSLIHFKLFFSEIIPTTVKPTSLYKGSYCPYCGDRWVNVNNALCSTCGRSLFWKSDKTFCPYCGHLIFQNTSNCPHCGEYVTSLPLLTEMWQMRLSGRLQRILYGVSKVLENVSDRLDISSIQYVYMGITASLFAFLSFFICVETEYIFIGTTPYVHFHYGFPFEWLELLTLRREWSSYSFYPLEIRTTLTAIVLNLVFCFLLAFIIVYGFKKLYDFIKR